MKISKKYPIVTKGSSNIFWKKNNSANFWFGGGDLLSNRKFVSKQDDILESIKKMFVEIQVLKKNKKKFKEFSWVITYLVPTSRQLKQYKTKKEYIDKKKNERLHFLEVISNWKNNNRLEVSSDLFLTTKKKGKFPYGRGIEILINSTKIIKNLKYLNFKPGYLIHGWLKPSASQDHYIQNKLGRYEWFTAFIDIKNRILHSKSAFKITKKDKKIHGDNLLEILNKSYEKDTKGKDYGVDLEALQYLRKKISSKVKFIFYKLDKTETKILKKYKII